MEHSVTVADIGRKVGSRPASGRFLADCPYCREELEVVPRGGLCRRCRSTVGVEGYGNLIEEGLR